MMKKSGEVGSKAELEKLKSESYMLEARERSSSSVAEAGFGEAELDLIDNENQDFDLFTTQIDKQTASKIYGLLRGLCSVAVLSCLAYSACSISMTLVNKVILTTYHFKYHMLLLSYQNGTCVVLLQAAKYMGWIGFESIDKKKLVAWIPLNFLFVGMLLTSFFSLNLLSVPMATIFKNSTNILITAGDYFFYGRYVSKGIAGSLALMLIGAIFAGRTDLEFNAAGYFWAVCNCFVTAAYVLYMPRAMQDSKLNAFGRVYYNNLLSIPLVLLADLTLFDNVGSLLSSLEDDPDGTYASAGFVATILFSGFIGFFLSLTSFHCVQVTSPTTYAMVGAMNKIPLAAIGVIIFNTQLNSQSVFFIGVSLAAGTMYAYSKSQLNSTKLKTNSESKLPMTDKK